MHHLRLADHFKQATWDSHTEAETSGIINDILRGRASIERYIHFLSNLLPVYEALERSNDWLNTFPEMQPFFDESIFRSEAIQNDLTCLMDFSGLDLSPYHRKSGGYKEHIEDALVFNHPAILAHIYVRYLGDLNGGAVLKRLLSKHLNLSETCLTFYEFPKIEDLADFRNRFREALNSVKISEEETQRATKAAVDAFKFNIAISNAV